jgi:formylglycine-generating enzyme required for sulfatase activity
MRLCVSRAVLLLLPALLLPALLLPSAAAGAQPPHGEAAQSGDDAENRRIAAKVEQLGDELFARREAAASELKALGEVALPALRSAAAHAPDLEIRWRARALDLAIMRTACTSDSTGMRLVLIEAGEFQMGSPAAEDERRADEARHPVRITRPFLLGTHEVTQAVYLQLMEANPSWFSGEGGGKAKVADQDTTAFPVEGVSWYDAVEFCNRLSARDGLEPYYRLADAKRDGNTIVAAAITVAGGIGYRLPTEAEWEYACRAGSGARFSFGDKCSGAELNVNFRHTTGYGGPSRVPGLGRTNKIGSYAANRWGLFDMHGNVAEWCADWYDKEYYAASPRDNPPGPERGVHRVLRGGSWLVAEANCRSAARMLHLPGDRHYYTGFRIARNPSHYMLSGR